MYRWLSLFVLVSLLAACQRTTSVLSWISPSQASTVSGTVTLEVQAQGERAGVVRGVVFFLDDRELGRAVQEGDRFTLTWDTARVEPGDYRLRAVPYGGPGITQVVTVARRGGGGVVTTPGTPDDGDGGEASSDDPLNLDWIFGFWPGAAETPAGEAIAHTPGGFPWGALWPAEVVQARLRGALHPTQQGSDVVKLPRGEIRYDSELEQWVVTRSEAGGLQISFDYPDPETLETHTVQINVIWDRYQPTTVVQRGEMRIEVPQGASLLVQDNEADLLDLDITAEWFTPPGCNRPTLFPASLLLEGYIDHPRPAEEDPGQAPAQDEGDAPEAPESTLDTTDLVLELTFEETNRREDPYTLVSSLELGATTEEGFEALLSWIVALTGEASFEDCALAGATLGEMDLYTSAMFGPEEGPYRGSSLALELSDLTYNDDGIPVGTDLEAELTAFDEAAGQEDVTTAEATLTFDEEEGLTAEGEVTLPDGETVDVVEYVQGIIETYMYMAELDGAGF